jgi:hypothetical protein
MNEHEPSWVTAFREAINALDTAISEFLHDEPNAEEAASALVALNMAKAEVGYCYDFMAKGVSDIMDKEHEVALPDGSRVEKKWSNSRSGWQHKELASVVAQRIVNLSVDMDTGEIIATPEQMVQQILDFVQPSYWRVKDLQRIGIDADRYCEVKDAKPSIIVRKAKS